ncbi:hypothetical protein [Armatimonas sp.]|uniref:hypothetical protein n=1 Tax=Armatimonas sp. TaxID=1872638 RepID=UPI003753708C
MEIEEKLKDAADWRPGSEMPLGLERRALAGRARPPLRPIGIARPRSVLFATAMAGAACMLIVARVDKLFPEAEPTIKPHVEQKIQPMPKKTNKPSGLLPTGEKTIPEKSVQEPKHFEESSRHFKEIPRKKQESPLLQRFPVAVETPGDSVGTGSRVAVEAPLYTPAYYAQPSADGESVQYMPVTVALEDPDVIYSESQQEN